MWTMAQLLGIKLLYLCSIFFIHGVCLASSQFPEGIELKSYICNLEASLSGASPETSGDLQRQLAKAYYKDQEQEKAFVIFLQSLNSMGISSTPRSQSKEEAAIYEEALAMYLNHNGKSIQEIARALCKQYASLVTSTGNYQLGFLVAAAYANLGQFTDFFDLFYQAYQADPGHYLAYKTKAILHIKLFEKARSKEEKEIQRQSILTHLILASELFMKDTSLYKMMIAYAPETKKTDILIASLKKIIDNNMITSRSDILFYVQQAIGARQFDLAQQFIDQSRNWYQYSRIIDNAQQELDKHKKT
jgi:tetratricopeptide (TPR) repeat protein